MRKLTAAAPSGAGEGGCPEYGARWVAGVDRSVTGPAAVGKTTALLRVGRACRLARTRKNPVPPGSAHGVVPVAYVLAPPGATAKTLITEFARYLGIPTTGTPTADLLKDLTERLPAPCGHDVVVLGGGAAGCVVAARLGEDPGLWVAMMSRCPEGSYSVIRREQASLPS